MHVHDHAPDQVRFLKKTKRSSRKLRLKGSGSLYKGSRNNGLAVQAKQGCKGEKGKKTCSRSCSAIHHDDQNKHLQKRAQRRHKRAAKILTKSGDTKRNHVSTENLGKTGDSRRSHSTSLSFSFYIVIHIIAVCTKNSDTCA